MFSDRWALNDPQPPAKTGRTSIQRNWLGDIVGGTRIEYVPTAAGGIGDFRRIYRDANGQDAYMDLSPSERVGQYSDSNRDAWRERKRTEAAQAGTDRRTAVQQEESNRRFNVTTGITRDQIAATADHQRGQLGLLTKQLEIQGAQIKAQSKQAEEALKQRAREGADQKELAVLGLNLQSKQMELGNHLAESKMMIESNQFDRQMAMDEKTNRRTKVMGALTLIAQSAARL